MRWRRQWPPAWRNWLLRFASTIIGACIASDQYGPADEIKQGNLRQMRTTAVATNTPGATRPSPRIAIAHTGLSCHVGMQVQGRGCIIVLHLQIRACSAAPRTRIRGIGSFTGFLQIKPNVEPRSSFHLIGSPAYAQELPGLDGQ